MLSVPLLMNSQLCLRLPFYGGMVTHRYE